MSERLDIKDFTRRDGSFTFVDLISFRNAQNNQPSPTPDGPSVMMNLTMDDVAQLDQRIQEGTAQNAENQRQSIELAECQYCN